jgi:hypothetical protein
MQRLPELLQMHVAMLNTELAVERVPYLCGLVHRVELTKGVHR